MSQQPAEPSGPPLHPTSSSDPGPGPGSSGERWGAHPLDPPAHPAGWDPRRVGEGQQGSPSQPDDQQTPWGWGGPVGPGPGWGAPTTPTGWGPPGDPGHQPQGGFAPRSSSAEPGYGSQPSGYPGYRQQQGHGQQGYGPPAGWGSPSPQAPGGPPLRPTDENLWALLAHLSIPFVGFVGPLVVYLVFKDRSAWLKESGVEALNFSLLYTIAVTACSLLSVVLIGAVLLPVVFIGALVLAVLAAAAANRHELYRYPVNWRLVR